MRRIKNVKELRESLKRGKHEFRLSLAGGIIFSRKTISLKSDGRFRVLNGIDDSVQTLTGRELYTRSNIGKGMRVGAFWEEGE
jgi:hypothetical protein